MASAVQGVGSSTPVQVQPSSDTDNSQSKASASESPDDRSSARVNDAGFFTRSGELRDSRSVQQEMRAEDQAVRERARAASQGAGSGSSSEDPFSKVEERTAQQVSRATEQISGAQEELSSAQAINKEERAILRQAKTLIGEEGSEEKLKKLEQRFNEIQEKRAALAQGVAQSNRSRVEAGRVTVTQGNKSFGSFGPDSVQVDGRREVDFSSKKSISQGLKDVREEAKSLRRQERNLSEEQSAVDSVAAQTSSDLDTLRRVSQRSGETTVVQGGDGGVANALDAYNTARTITAQTLLGKA